MYPFDLLVLCYFDIEARTGSRLCFRFSASSVRKCHRRGKKGSQFYDVAWCDCFEVWTLWMWFCLLIECEIRETFSSSKIGYKTISNKLLNLASSEACSTLSRHWNAERCGCGGLVLCHLRGGLSRLRWEFSKWPAGMATNVRFINSVQLLLAYFLLYAYSWYSFFFQLGKKYLFLWI